MAENNRSTVVEVSFVTCASCWRSTTEGGNRRMLLVLFGTRHVYTSCVSRLALCSCPPKANVKLSTLVSYLASSTRRRNLRPTSSSGTISRPVSPSPFVTSFAVHVVVNWFCKNGTRNQCCCFPARVAGCYSSQPAAGKVTGSCTCYRGVCARDRGPFLSLI